MSDTQVQPVEVRQDATETDMDHWHCCRDADAILCGLDGTGWPIVASMTVQCVVCDAEANAGRCPRFGRCIEDYEVHN